MFHSVIFRQILCLFSFSTFISREEPQKHHPQEVARAKSAPFQQVLILSLLSADIKGLTQVFGVSQCQLCAQCLKDTRMFSCSEIALFWHKNETKRWGKINMKRAPPALGLFIWLTMWARTSEANCLGDERVAIPIMNWYVHFKENPRLHIKFS